MGLGCEMVVGGIPIYLIMAEIFRMVCEMCQGVIDRCAKQILAVINTGGFRHLLFPSPYFIVRQDRGKVN